MQILYKSQFKTFLHYLPIYTCHYLCKNTAKLKLHIFKAVEWKIFWKRNTFCYLVICHLRK